MKRYLIMTGILVVFFLLLFLLVEALGIPILTDPGPWLSRGGPLEALLGVSLLVADVLLPVPSSLVMVAHGAMFGVLVGTLLSLTGSVGATMLGFAIGRRGGRLLERAVSPAERVRANDFLNRWGMLAIIITRPVPLLAETVAIVAGTTRLGWRRVALAALAGSLPAALLYALTGAAIANFQSSTLMFGLVILIAGIFWIIGRRFEAQAKSESGSSKLTE